jgi:hypothetical protein
MHWIENYANRYRMHYAASVAWQMCKPDGLSFWQVPQSGRPSYGFTKPQ